jgi:hypothetical protein
MRRRSQIVLSCSRNACRGTGQRSRASARVAGRIGYCRLRVRFCWPRRFGAVIGNEPRIKGRSVMAAPLGQEWRSKSRTAPAKRQRFAAGQSFYCYSAGLSLGTNRRTYSQSLPRYQRASVFALCMMSRRMPAPPSHSQFLLGRRRPSPRTCLFPPRKRYPACCRPPC